MLLFNILHRKCTFAIEKPKFIISFQKIQSANYSNALKKLLHSFLEISGKAYMLACMTEHFVTCGPLFQSLTNMFTGVTALFLIQSQSFKVVHIRKLAGPDNLESDNLIAQPLTHFFLICWCSQIKIFCMEICICLHILFKEIDPAGLNIC